MKYKCTMLVVNDIKKSVEFYTHILQLKIISDLGANVTLSGGVALQTRESWQQFTNSQIACVFEPNNNVELYFEENHFDKFIERIENKELEFLGEKITTFPWEQRVARFYDPDRHIIHVGEDLVTVVKRLHHQEMHLDEIIKKTYCPKDIAEKIILSFDKR